MFNFENTEASIPIVKVESSPSTSTSVDRVSNENPDTSSKKSIGTSAENFPQKNDGILLVPSVRASISSSFDGLTIPIVSPYGEVIATDLTTRELPDPSILHREADNSDSHEELSKTKNWLLGDLVLKNNTMRHKLPTLALEVDYTRFRMFYMTTCGVISDYFIPIPVDHFLASLNIPLDPTFYDFFTMISSQPAHVH